MRYSIVLSALVASALATPYVNVEVTDGEITEEMSRGRNRGGLRRHHGNRRYHVEEEESQGFFSSLWNRNRRNRNRSRSRSRNRSRSGSRNRRHRSYDSMNMIDDLFGTNYECIIEGRSGRDERRDARECCRENGGEVSDLKGHCIFRDVLRNPREDWRNCALEQRGAEFADCYYREQREVDDELELSRHRRHGGRRRGSRDSSDGRRRGSGFEYDDELVLENDNDNTNRRENQYECSIDMMDDQRRQEIMQTCCEDVVKGRLDQNGQVCEFRGRGERQSFERCAINEGAENAQCQRQ